MVRIQRNLRQPSTTGRNSAKINGPSRKSRQKPWHSANNSVTRRLSWTWPTKANLGGWRSQRAGPTQRQNKQTKSTKSTKSTNKQTNSETQAREVAVARYGAGQSTRSVLIRSENATRSVVDGCDRFPPDSTGFYRNLPSVTGFYLVLPGFT